MPDILREVIEESWLDIFVVGITLIFTVPILVLNCVQTMNMLTNETTSERNSKRRQIKTIEETSTPSNSRDRIFTKPSSFTTMLSNCR